MGDNSLTADELDQLLNQAGGDVEELAPLAEEESDSPLLAEMQKAQAACMSGLQEFLGKPVESPKFSVSRRSKVDVLNSVGTPLVRLSSDISGDASGQVQFLISEENAKKLLALILDQEQETLDADSLPGLDEAFSTYLSTFITSLGGGGGTSFTPSPVTSVLEGPGETDLPLSDYEVAEYSFQLGDLPDPIVFHEMWEPALVEAMAPVPVADAAAPEGMVGGAQPRGGGSATGYVPVAQTVQLPPLASEEMTPEGKQNINLLMDVEMELSVELGRTHWKIRDILGIGEGTIIELEKLNGEPVDVLVNRRLIAKGEVVIIDENFGVRVTEIVTPLEQLGYGTLA